MPVWVFGVVSALLFFIMCQLFACLIRAATDFSFATSICGLVSFFNGLFCRRPSCQTFVFALLALVSGYQCISQVLVSCCALAARQLALEIRTEIFRSRLPCGHPYKFRFEANSIWFSIKCTKSHSASARYINGHD